MTATSTALLAIAPTKVQAQAPGAAIAPPPKLAEFREAFETAVEARSAPALKRFADGLAELARSRAEHGDYEGAIRARDRLAELMLSKPEATGDPASREGEIVVDLASANRAGSGLKYDVREGKIIGFTKNSQSLRWEFSKTVPGIYSAIVTYSCGEPETKPDTGVTISTGGRFTLAETTNLTTSGSEPLVRRVAPTGGWDKSITRNIGKITVTGSRLTLALTVDQAAPGGLMHLYGIRLIPVIDSSGTSASGADQTPAELAELREKFRNAIAPNTSPVIMRYGTALRSMLESASGAPQLENALQVESAFEAAEKLSKDPTLIYRSQPTP